MPGRKKILSVIKVTSTNETGNCQIILLQHILFEQSFRHQSYATLHAVPEMLRHQTEPSILWCQEEERLLVTSDFYLPSFVFFTFKKDLSTDDMTRGQPTGNSVDPRCRSAMAS